MAKLTQDEIKWILSIDAKGVNKEIAVTSSEINKLAQANKVMNADMKAAEKQLKETERSMAKLSKAGKEDSKVFQELKATRDSAREDIDDYTKKIGENNRAIEQNKTKIEELGKSMDLNEMTMNQLRQRASELKKQLNVTSLSADPKTYESLQKELSAVENRMEFVGRQGKGLISQFAGMNHPVGTAAKAVQGFGQALKALIANPVGAVIAAIVLVFLALKNALSSSEEATNKFHQIMAPLKLLMDGVLLILQKTVGFLLDLTVAILDFAAKAAEKLPFVGKWFGELNEKSKEAIALEKEKQNLRVRERESLITNSKKERDIAELRNKAKQRDIYTNEQIIGFLDEAIQLEKEIAQEKVEQAKISLHILETEAARAQNTEEMNRKIAEQTALVTQLETDFYKKSRQLESERFSRIDEMRREDAAAAKEALEKKISNIEYALTEETKLLKQQLASQEITRAEYERQVEQKTIETLHKKLEIAGLERDKRIEIEQQVLDFKIKALELEEQFQKERAAIAENWSGRFLENNEKEIRSLNAKYEKELEDLSAALDKQAITEVQYLEYKTRLLAEKEEELKEKKRLQQEADAEKELADLNTKKEEEKMFLQQAYAAGLISKEEYERALLSIETRYLNQALGIANLSAASRMAIEQQLLNRSISNQEELTAKQEAEQKKREQLYFQFSTQIGSMLGGFIAGNEDLVHSSLKTILNMALDALEAQITLSIASATAQSFAQPDAVLSFGATGFTRAAILTGLIKAAFAGVKTIVNSALSGGSSKSSGTSAQGGANTTTRRVVTGKQSGGYIDVSREQDGRYFRALLNPRKRGYVDRPTVIVGDGPEGKSREWIANNDALQNPTVAPIIKLLNEAQQAGTIRTIDLNHIMRTRMAGFQSGGFLHDNLIARSMHKSGDREIPLAQTKEGWADPIFKEIKDLLHYLKTKGVKSSVNYQEFRKADDLIKSVETKAKRK